MARLPFFVASCPNCSMKKQVELTALGRHSDCLFCGKTFTAQGADSTSAALDDPLHYWINFTDHSILEPDLYAVDNREIGRTPR